MGGVRNFVAFVWRRCRLVPAGCPGTWHVQSRHLPLSMCSPCRSWVVSDPHAFPRECSDRLGWKAHVLQLRALGTSSVVRVSPSPVTNRLILRSPARQRKDRGCAAAMVILVSGLQMLQVQAVCPHAAEFDSARLCGGP